MPRPLPERLIAVVALLLGAGCTDLSQPTGPGGPPAGPDLRSSAQQQADDPVALARGVRGFGGFFLDASGVPTVYLTDPAQRGAAERALAPFLQAHGITAPLKALRADFEYQRLEQWFDTMSPEALAVPGAVFADLDEAQNRLRIGVSPGASGSEVRRLAAAAGIPASAVVIQETSPIRQMSQLPRLDERVRPVLGGLQIDFILGVCSLGFNALRNGVLSFITTSHCTWNQGGVEGTIFYQETWFDLSGLGTTIGTEVADPVYFSSPRRKSGVCPRNRVCRYSDTSRGQYSIPPAYVALGWITRPTGQNNLSLDFDVNQSFQIDPSAPKASSATTYPNPIMNKVGRTTGWTSGLVSGTCVNVDVYGTSITQLCQTLVGSEAPGSPVLVGAGDSGSPVFMVNSNGKVTLAGILWGGSEEGGLFVFSPMVNIQRSGELGELVVAP